MIDHLLEREPIAIRSFPTFGAWFLMCRRAFKTDQLCALNFDQGLKPPVIGMAVDKCNVFSKFGVSSGLV